MKRIRLLDQVQYSEVSDNTTECYLVDDLNFTTSLEFLESNYIVGYLERNLLKSVLIFINPNTNKHFCIFYSKPEIDNFVRDYPIITVEGIEYKTSSKLLFQFVYVVILEVI